MVQSHFRPLGFSYAHFLFDHLVEALLGHAKLVIAVMEIPEQAPPGVVRVASRDGWPASLGQRHLRGGHRNVVLIDYRDEQGLVGLRFGGTCPACGGAT